MLNWASQKVWIMLRVRVFLNNQLDENDWSRYEVWLDETLVSRYQSRISEMAKNDV